MEDIIDSGLTLSRLQKMLESRNPASLNTCVLLRKPDRLKCDLTIQYLGFDIPDEWVVGFGLDYAEMYRTLPYVGILKFEEEESGQSS